MPVQDLHEDDRLDDNVEETVEETALVRPDGTPTVAAEIIADFLEDVDWDAIFDDADIQPFVENTDLYLVPVSEDEDASRILLTPTELAEFNEANNTKYGPDHGKNYRGAYYINSTEKNEADEDVPAIVLVAEEEGGVDYNDEDGVLVLRGESIDGDIVAEFIDEEDLFEMFIYHLNEELDPDTLADRAVFVEFADLMDGEQLDEKKSPFKRGQFRKGPFKAAKPGGSGNAGKLHNMRARMIMAMMKKGAIKRVAKGTGYKGGDYEYDSPKGKGKPSMVKKWQKVRRKNYRRVSDIKKMVDPARTKVVSTVYKNLGSKMPKPYVPSERRQAARRKKSAKDIKTLRAGGKLKAGGGKSASARNREAQGAMSAAKRRAKGVVAKATGAMSKLAGKKKAAAKKGPAKKKAGKKAAALFKGKGKKKKATVESIQTGFVAGRDLSEMAAGAVGSIAKLNEDVNKD